MALLDLSVLCDFHLREHPEEEDQKQSTSIECKTGAELGSPEHLLLRAPQRWKPQGAGEEKGKRREGLGRPRVEGGLVNCELSRQF